MIFDYPPPQPHRRHGPDGYLSYEAFRPWLRDEFCFRCVYCLKRETWEQFRGDFDIDHFEPQAVNPVRELDYENLVYACHNCNLAKGERIVADPLSALTSNSVVMLSDGSLKAIDAKARKFINDLDLNSPKLIRWRQMWLEVVELAKNHRPELYSSLVGFPESLPDLKRLRPQVNHRPEGLQRSFFARRQRSELPQTY